MRDRKPIFILGAPRSGTTFLASLLKGSEYGAPFETQFITKYYKRIAGYGDLSEYNNFEKLINDILSERAVMQWGLKLDIKQFFAQCSDSYSYANVVDRLCLLGRGDSSALNWGDKTPHYLGDVDILYELFPEAKYIYIVRDGRDVALSLLRKPWGPNNIYSAAKYWVLLNSQAEVLKRMRDGGTFMQLRYEDLVNDTQNYLDALCEFTHSSYPDDLHDELAGSVMVSNYEKWRSEMSVAEIKLFEQIAADTLERFGYATTHRVEPVSWPRKVFYESHEFLLRARQLFIENVIDTIKIKYFGKQPFAD